MEIADTQVVERAKKYRSYSMKDRLKAVSMSESGMGSVSIGRELGIDSSLIRGWIRRYKKEGLDGLKPKSHRNGICGSALQQAGSEKETPSRRDGKKGFVHFVDNPVLVRSMVNTLSAYGLPIDDIVVGDDARQFAHSMAAGETLVLNSLFDLSSDFSKMLYIIEDLLRAGISIVSISDKGLEIKPGDTDSLGLVSILKNYLSYSMEDVRQTGDDAGHQPGYQAVQSILQTPHSKKEQGFLAALDLYRKGHTMASAARLAGCSYNSFRYWYIKHYRDGVSDVIASAM